MLVAVPFRLPMAVRATFGIEGSLKPREHRPQHCRHLFNHMILTYPQAISHQLRWQMAITKMPRNPHQMPDILTGDVNDRLILRPNLNAAPIFKNEDIAVPHGFQFRQIQKKPLPAIRFQLQPTTAAMVEIKCDRIHNLTVKIGIRRAYVYCMFHNLLNT